MITVGRTAIASAGFALLAIAACGSDAGPPDANAPGTFSLSWGIMSGTRALSCAQISAIIVKVTVTSGPFVAVDSLSCNVGASKTRMLSPGVYDVSVELDGASGALAPAQTFPNAKVTASTDTPLGALVFQVDASGGLTFEVAATGATANCTPVSGGGAGIDAMTLQVRGPTNNCEPATFHIAAGATGTASDYVSDCNTLAPGPCIESDQVVTVTGIDSGTAKLALVGQITGNACWSVSSSQSVPAMSMVRDAGSIALAYDHTACPP